MDSEETNRQQRTTNLVHPKYVDCSALLLVLAWFVFICLYTNSHILFYYEALYMVGRGYSCAEQTVRKGVDRSYNTYTQTSAAHCSMCLQITGQILFIDTKSSGGETDSILAWHAISHSDKHASLALFSCLPKQLLYKLTRGSRTQTFNTNITKTVIFRH